MRRLTVPISAALAALILFGCGRSSRPARTRTVSSALRAPSASTRSATRPSVPPPSPAQITRAARLTAAQPGFRADVSARIGLPRLGGNSVSAVGSGRFDPGSASGTLSLAIEPPGLLSLAGQVPAQVVLTGGEAYVRIPRDVARELHASTWLGVGVARLGLGSSLTPPEILGDVARDATSHVPGQRATVTIDRGSGLVRTISLSYLAAGGYHVHIRLRFTGFGPEPPAEAPPADATGSLARAVARLGF